MRTKLQQRIPAWYLTLRKSLKVHKTYNAIIGAQLVPVKSSDSDLRSFCLLVIGAGTRLRRSNEPSPKPKSEHAAVSDGACPFQNLIAREHPLHRYCVFFGVAITLTSVPRSRISKPTPHVAWRHETWKVVDIQCATLSSSNLRDTDNQIGGNPPRRWAPVP